MLLQRSQKPHFIFASPNIPNPEVYLRLVDETVENTYENKMASAYSPVIQVKFLMDFVNKKISVYNERNNNTIHIADMKKQGMELKHILQLFEYINTTLPPQERKQTIVYYNGRTKAITAARDYAEALPYKIDNELNVLSKNIAQEVHGDYYLADMIKKGVAYHIGYLPASIRKRIEDLF